MILFKKLSLILAICIPSTLMAYSLSDELNLSPSQQQQLKQFKEKRKLQLQESKKQQLIADQQALNTFLNEQQVQQIIQQQLYKKRIRPSGIQRLMAKKDVLNLTENQVIQLQQIPESIDSTLSKKAKRQQIKQQIASILNEQQLEQIQQLKREKNREQTRQ